MHTKHFVVINHALFAVVPIFLIKELDLKIKFRARKVRFFITEKVQVTITSEELKDLL